MDAREDPDAAGARRRRLRRRWLVGAIVLIGAVVASEFALRWALFSSGSRPKFVRGLRNPKLYAEASSEDLYWKLHYRWTPQTRRVDDPPVFDPLVGWLRDEVTPETYVHADAADLGGRRPLLLYGDSFANCVTPRGGCFETLADEAEMGKEFRLVNYGVGGFGLDQAFLLMRSSIDHYVELEPLVVFSLFVDGDIDRCVLGLRDWSKPRFVESEGGWTVEPPIEGTRKYFEQHPIRAGSYLLRYLVQGLLPPDARTGVLGTPTRADKERIARHVFASLKSELDGRGVPFFVLLFHSLRSLRSDDELIWQETFVRSTLDELDIPYVSLRTDIRRVADASGRELDAFFIPRGQRGVGHHNRAGNRVGIRSIERGLRGRFDGGGAQRSAKAGQ